MRVRELSVLLVFVILGTGPAFPASTQTPQPNQPNAELSPDQGDIVTAAGKDLGAQHWAEAIAKLEPLLRAAPVNAQVAKMFAEAEINVGKPVEASAVLSRVLSTNPKDAQALAILAHAQASQKQWGELEGTLKRLQQLHDGGQSNLNQIPLGDDPLPNIGHVQWLYYLQPSWSRYNVYSMARVLSADGVVRERITLESGDGDQPLFAKQHPEDAARGLRSFSLDGYVNTDDHTQTHYTYAFFVGQPSFATFRDKVLAVASGTLKPISSRSNLTVPPPAR